MLTSFRGVFDNEVINFAHKAIQRLEKYTQMSQSTLQSRRLIPKLSLSPSPATAGGKGGKPPTPLTDL